jgi:CHAT domain-containing protein
MMTAFYRELLKGCTKREALINAQNELRSNGYKDARYWATFILLDALDQ